MMKRSSSPNNNITSSSSSGATGSSSSSLAKYQQQQSNQTAFLTGGTLIAAIPRSTINSKTLISTRNRTIGSGVATNIIPDEKLLVADDQASEQSLLTLSSSSMNRFKRASTAEVARIVQDVVVPASNSAVENIRCVAYRILATVSNEYFTVCVVPPEENQDQRKEIEENATIEDCNNNSPSPPFTLFTKSQIEKQIVQMITVKCRGEVDEPRLEALTACFNFIANCPCLAKIANQKISIVVCEDLIGKNLVSNGDTRTRCCQVLEALAERIEFYCLDDEEITVAECSRILRAASSILAANEKQIRQLNQNIQQNSGTSNLVFTETQRNELNTQIACCLRAIGSAVCHLPEDYLFMEFGSRGDDVVSWAYELMIDYFQKYSNPSWLNLNYAPSPSSNNQKSSPTTNAKRHHSSASSSSFGSDDHSSSSGGVATLVDAAVTEDETIIMIAALDGLCRLSSKRGVADCDSESTAKTLRILLQTTNLFSSITELSNEIYFLCGGALRLGAKLFVEMSRNKSGTAYFDYDDGVVVVIIAEFIRSTITALYRASTDADIVRGVLRNEFNESCLVCIFALVGLMTEEEKKKTKLFSSCNIVDTDNIQAVVDEDEEQQEQEDAELMVLEFLKLSFPQVVHVLKSMIPTAEEIQEKMKRRRRRNKRNKNQNNDEDSTSDSDDDDHEDVKNEEQKMRSEFEKERSKSKFLANWS